MIFSIDLYADDTTIYDIQFDKMQLENNLQHVLNLLHTWCLENGMFLNTDKTKLMLIANRQKRNAMADNNLTVNYNNIELHLTSSEKILGVKFEDNLEWTNHSQHVSKKISSYLCFLSQIKSYLSQHHRDLFYNRYIKPHLN